MKLKALLSITALCIGYIASSGQSPHKMYLYGTIYTIQGDEFTGQIRWGKEEGYWTDMFNAGKVDNPHIDNLNREDYELFKDDSWRNDRDDDVFLFGMGRRVIRNWEDNNNTHQFSCRFGDIASLTYKGRQRVEVELRNGDIIDVKGQGYNDIGGDIKFYSPTEGKISFDDDAIDHIVFKSPSEPFESPWGEPLFGRVYTTSGEFSGLIQWDKDERFSKDELNGENRNGDYDILFESIASIQKDGAGSLITLINGKEIFLRGTNDVNRENRGIIISQPDLGRVEIPWEAFEKVEFLPETATTFPSFSDFPVAKPISGIVVLMDNTRQTGELAFDLDEYYDMEVLNGEIDDISLEIPFRNISSIMPISNDRSELLLLSGQKVILEDSQDVSNRNDGVLVYLSSKKTSYIPWYEVKEILLQD